MNGLKAKNNKINSLLLQTSPYLIYKQNNLFHL